jgi:hypothetical protein
VGLEGIEELREWKGKRQRKGRREKEGGRIVNVGTCP